MNYQLLGPLTLREDGREIALPGRKERALLLALLLRPNEAVPRDWLVEALWEEEPPPTASGALYVFVSHVRAAIGKTAVRTRDGRYELEVDVAQIDAHRFEQLAREGRELLESGRPADALRPLRAALALWRGPAFGDLADLRFAQPAAARLEELRLGALEDRLEAELAHGGGGDQVAELEALVAQHPLRERLLGLLMRALYAAGRQADALEAYGRARETLVAERGLEPGPALRRLHQSILRQDPELEPEPQRAPGPAGALPTSATTLVGREEELRRLSDLLRRPDVHLVTVTGIGGIGKTRLAIEAARRLEDDFTDGVFVVELWALTDPTLVLDAVAQALEIVVRGEEPLEDVLRRRLLDRSTLIVLDNFEHLLGAATIAAALAQIPGVKILVTSVAALRVAVEHEFELPPLEVPSALVGTDLGAFGDVPAVALFVERARAVRNDFVLSDENAPAVAELCRRLEGLPLAIELVAARSKLLPPATLLARLRGRLDVPTAEVRDLPARQQTLRATIDWSYAVLEPAEQLLLARLAVFTGGCTLEAIDAVCGAGEDVVDLLSGLADKSFVRRTGEQEPRFRMLETVREYALERLELLGELEEVRRRHADYFLALAERAEPELSAGPRQAQWFERLEADHENFRAALTWSASVGDATLNLRLAAALGRFWHVRGYTGEGYRWLRDAIRIGADEPTWIRAKVLNRAGALTTRYGLYAEGTQLLEESLELYRRIGDAEGVALTAVLLGDRPAFEGDFDRAALLYAEAVDLFRRLENRRDLAVAVGNLGMVELSRSNDARATELFSESVELSRQVDDKLNLAVMLGNLGLAEVGADLHVQARASLDEAITLMRELGCKEQLAYPVVGLAVLAAAQGADARAVELAGAADGLAEASGAKLQPFEHRLLERTIGTLRTRLEEEAFAAAWARGRSRQLEAV